jgi:hypothetical protein
LFDSMVRTYRDVFDGLAIIDVEHASNRIIVGARDPRRTNPDAIVAGARALTKRLKLRNDLGEMVERGLRHDVSYGESGRVLRDGDRRPLEIVR